MIEPPSPPRRVDPEARRALQLDTLAAILPMDRRDRLAQLLTDDDVATLKHLAREGMGENSLRALASDLAYLEGWSQAATGKKLAVASDRGADAKIYRASPVGPRQARERSTARDAGRRRRLAASRRAASARGTACPKHGQAPLGKLGHAASLEGNRGTVRGAKPAFGRTPRGARLPAPAYPQKQTGRHPRRAGPIDRHLRDGSPGGYARSGDSASEPLRPVVAGVARWRGCVSSKSAMNRPCRSIRMTPSR